MREIATAAKFKEVMVLLPHVRAHAERGNAITLVVYVGVMPQSVTISSLTATSSIVSWTHPNFIPVNYTVTLTQVSQVCTEVQESIPAKTFMATANSSEFTDLHEISTYNVTVSASFSALNFSTTTPDSMVFTTLSAGT